MEKVETINPQRIAWCCDEQGITIEQLAVDVGIAPTTLLQLMDGDKSLSINQLRLIARYFNRGMLFFLEQDPVNEGKVHSPQFRTISNQKPEISRKLKALIERVEHQRQIYIGLLEDLGEDVGKSWYPTTLQFDVKRIKLAAAEARDWLDLEEGIDFQQLRSAVEHKGILVFVSNGYKGQWQIAKDNPIRGFSLYFDCYPVIAIKKQSTEGPQAFTLMHELAHLLLHRKSFIDDEDDFSSYQGKEKIANEFAGNVLVPDHFLAQISTLNFPMGEVSSYDNYLKDYRKRWCVSGEVILRRMLNEGLLAQEHYQAYREYKASLPQTEGGGGARYRYREPVRMFGESFVQTVLDALHNQQITLARASTYLDNLKIKDLRRLEDAHARI
ncbi:MAG: ImmA/IrrE family metallo-endopeptidase [Candidatus Thiodiazotropha endolucinida]